ncbi:MAG: AAA family ATPase [Thioploca sp.]|nr:AAA family ATPase [Thioploca sp.]
MNPETTEIFQPEIRIKKLKLENFRGFEQLELEFHQDLTVLIGENGAGKTAILDCLAIFLNIFLEEIIKRKKELENHIEILDIKQDTFETTDEISLLVEHQQAIGEINYGITLTKDYEFSLSRKIVIPWQWKTTNRNLPILIYYPTSTAALINFIDFKDARYNFRTDILTIYDQALDKQAFNFTYFFEWYRWQENIEKQLDRNPTLDQVRQAIYSLLSDEHNQFANLAINWLNNPNGEMLIQKNATVLNINQLSAGEKTLLALVADLARRLAIANPYREQPLTGNGIVLIDEIDLHLHPRWQRHVIPRLRKIFPNCQFIVTTHSPLVLSQVKPENIVILENFQVVKNTPHTFGRDNNSILYELMNVKQRPDDMQKQLDKFYELLDDGNKIAAQELLKQLSQDLGEDDTAIVRAYHHLAFMDDTNETNSEK